MADFSSSRMSEKRFFTIEDRYLTANGGQDGSLTLATTFGYKVGQIISVSSTAQQPRRLKIKRIVSDTKMFVGDEKAKITDYADVSDLLVSDSAVVQFSEQQRPVIDILEIQRQVYEEEPTIALRTHAVDWTGASFGEDHPMPVKSGTQWDEANITRDGDDDIVEVQFSKNGVPVETINLEYNGEKSITKVTKS